MRVFNVQPAARPQFYDRNPVPKSQLFSGAGIAPHADVIRWSYTVPVGKKAWVDGCTVYVIRDAAATAVNSCFCGIQYTPSGGAISRLNVCYQVVNTVGDQIHNSLTQIGALMPGDLIQADDSDISTGGTHVIEESAKYTEYDA